MTPRISIALCALLFATAAAAQTTTIVVSPGDSEQPTSMPDYCSQLDVNCVLDDGAPRRAVVGAFIDRAPATTPTPAAAAGETLTSRRSTTAGR
jgi:hypothetical protein